MAVYIRLWLAKYRHSPGKERGGDLSKLKACSISRVSSSPISNCKRKWPWPLFQALRTRNAFRDPGRYLVEIAVPDSAEIQDEDANGIPLTLDIYLWEGARGWIWVPMDPSEPFGYVFNDPNDEG